ncbi:MAG: hypothetical protein V5A46_08970 [Haloferacaceae archaeon]
MRDAGQKLAGACGNTPDRASWRTRSMKKSNSNARKRIDPRPAYIQLGEDTNDAFHVYRTTDETIHVVRDGKRVQKFVLNGRSVDDYVKFVRDEVDGRQWENRRYIADDEDPIAALIEDIVTEVAA